jgi:hypothetical protein
LLFLLFALIEKRNQDVEARRVAAAAAASAVAAQLDDADADLDVFDIRSFDEERMAIYRDLDSAFANPNPTRWNHFPRLTRE